MLAACCLSAVEQHAASSSCCCSVTFDLLLKTNEFLLFGIEGNLVNEAVVFVSLLVWSLHTFPPHMNLLSSAAALRGRRVPECSIPLWGRPPAPPPSRGSMVKSGISHSKSCSCGRRELLQKSLNNHVFPLIYSKYLSGEQIRAGGSCRWSGWRMGAPRGTLSS